MASELKFNGWTLDEVFLAGTLKLLEQHSFLTDSSAWYTNQRGSANMLTPLIYYRAKMHTVYLFLSVATLLQVIK